mmetsp:Transcript_4290/g.4948  ORF Transcript_4290/g.4948 Transcript_4290/m.4948 type:complete len:122 (-) Transcript_4290:443-808(-)|eukprot:CAMPEP_0197845796 /NCGR_PEP_ID=MMETSP1438-20131217/2673_1 /TAXON_ID=1461541 /ORGANISM="Pterosperma sp., Strain CCMP1384" /LENGTH=121 /DNA_ID=CAMNT_0043457225 /DNA_START=484 /DNA_END=849 /DNA_ORIENTATION=+
MPGDYEWKLIKERKNEEADEMGEIEKRLNSIYAGVDPKKVALLTCGTSANVRSNGPEVGTLLEYEEAKRLTAGDSAPVTPSLLKSGATKGESSQPESKSKPVDGVEGDSQSKAVQNMDLLD